MRVATIPLSYASLQSRVITKRRDFEELFEGFATLQGISYVVSPELLLEFFNDRGFTQVEMVVGENLSEHYKQDLLQQEYRTVDTLAGLVERGDLRILVPRKTIHSKLYILGDGQRVRVIAGSANFTETARQATSQVNYVWYVDLPPSDPLLASLLSDYQAQAKGCSLFMGDLADLLRDRKQEERREVIEAWLKGGLTREDEERVQGQEMLQELTDRSLEEADGNLERILTVELPEGPRARRQAESLLHLLDARISNGRASLPAGAYLGYVQRTHGMPLMRVDVERREVTIAADNSVSSRCEPLGEPAAIGAALQHLEDYIATIEWGRSSNLQRAKTSLFEALLYFFAAPFAHEHMKRRRQSYALVDSRGPQALYLYGQAQNGKSTFTRFALRLITGHHILPQPGAQFGMTKVKGAAAVGSVFPLVFDDVDLARKGPTFEQVLKSYWEVWWGESHPVPQLIFTGNTDNIKEWAKSRLKRVDFDVQFAASEDKKALLHQLLEIDNPLFKWFAYLYLEQVKGRDALGDDELSGARKVMRQLYTAAARPLPLYFPAQPIEELYNRGREDWLDLLYGIRKAEVRKERTRWQVVFKDDMQHPDINRYRAYLPQTVKSDKRGKTLVIESPKEFQEWLQATPGQADRSRWGKMIAGIFSR